MGVQSIKISVLRNALIITSGPIPLISPTDIPTRIGFLSVFKIKLSFGLFFCILFIFTPYSKGAYTKITIVWRDRKSTRLNSSHVRISYAVFCLKKKKKKKIKNKHIQILYTIE